MSENVLVPGGIAALARALDIDAPDAARCMSELARLVYGETRHERERDGSPYRRLITHFSGASTLTAGAVDVVPVPLTASLWSAVLGRSVRSSELFAAILSDPNAALVAHGLSALDDETLQFFAVHPAAVTTLYRQHAVVFASFAPYLRIRNGRVVTPAGDAAAPLWEAVLGARATDPAGFVLSLYRQAEGRLAYLYDVISHLDSAHAAFASGLWLPDPATRIDRFQALARAVSSTIGEWKPAAAPFSRPVADLLILMQRVQVDRTGAPRFPSSQRFWTAALSSERTGGHSPAPDQDLSIDAAWLAERLLDGHSVQRGERLDQYAFGHRVFASAPAAETADVIAAIGDFPQVPMLMLTLERIGVRRPETYLAMSRHARRLTQLDAAQEHRALAQFQGAVALIARMVTVGTLDAAAAERLLDALALTPIDARHGYLGAIAVFLERQVGPAIAWAPQGPFEEALMLALAGPRRNESLAQVAWEGQTYVFDLAGSEAIRLRRLRERGQRASLDTALAIAGNATALVATGSVEPNGGSLEELRSTLARLPDAARTRQQLSTASVRPSDLRIVLLEAVDLLTADALLSFSYAVALRDPTGRTRLDYELPRRHDFGLTASARRVRERTAWALPHLLFAPGQSWRVQGAVLGLDMALAPLALRKIDSQPPAVEPRILSTHRYTFVLSVGLLDEYALSDADAGAIAESISRGERRVGGLSAAGSDTTAIVDEIAMDGWRARALRWNLEHAPDKVPTLFSQTELLHLGGGGRLAANPWGMSALLTLGCLCTVIPPPGLNTGFVGRHQVGVLPAAVPDLNLRVAVLLHELQMPAALARRILESALYDLLADVRPLHPDDWLTVVRRARALSRERVEDSLAAVTAATGPLSPVRSSSGRQP